MRTSKNRILFASLLALALAFAGCGDGKNDLSSITPGEQSSALESDLLQLREEEKLARDVYITLHQKWGTEVFLKISKSEQKHTDKVKDLLDAFGIPDPVTDDTVGVFVDEELAALYWVLVEMGTMSEEDALLVGTTIEDLDIFDIREMRTHTDQAEVLSVYDVLECGSDNHMRAFTNELSTHDAQYQAQYLTEAEMQTILGQSSGSCGSGSH